MGELRQLFSKLGIQTSKVLEISYPNRTTIECLVLRSYSDPFRQCLRQAGIEMDPKFDSCKALNPLQSPIHSQRARELTARRISRIMDQTTSPLVAQYYSKFLSDRDIKELVPDPLKVRFENTPLQELILENRRRRRAHQDEALQMMDVVPALIPTQPDQDPAPEGIPATAVEGQEQQPDTSTPPNPPKTAQILTDELSEAMDTTPSQQ